MKKTAALFFILLLLGSLFLFGDDDNYLLFGLSVKPSFHNLGDSWWISQGRDFPLFALFTGGYETGMAYRIFEDVAEYHFKTFFNFKYDVVRLAKSTLYVGGGAGLLELLKVEKHDSNFGFFLGYQGILGLKIGPPKKDKFCLEIHFLDSLEEGRGLQINLLAGVKF